MLNVDWVKEFPAMISVCDMEGVILAMNDREAEFFKDRGGAALIGSSLYDCHQPASRAMIKEMMASESQRIYIVEEGDKRELIIQSPWYQDGKMAGLVEMAFELEGDIPHLMR